MVGVQEELFQTPGVTKNILGDRGERTVPFINKLHLSVAAFEDGYAAEHRG